MPALRNALISAYLSAAAGRRSLRAAKPQLDKARAARLSILKSISHLGKARFAQERGFGDVFGLPLSDPDAKFESGELGLTCWTVQRHLTQLMETLTDAINRESRKRVTNGRTQERLRTLIDKLADWWESLGKSIAPNIDAVRRGDPLKGKKEPAYIYGRTGEFLELAVSVFSEIDVFKPKRIETVLTHAYKARLKARNSAKLKQKKIT